MGALYLLLTTAFFRLQYHKLAYLLKTNLLEKIQIALSYFLKITNTIIEPFIYTTILWLVTSALFYYIIKNTNFYKMLY